MVISSILQFNHRINIATFILWFNVQRVGLALYTETKAPPSVSICCCIINHTKNVSACHVYATKSHERNSSSGKEPSRSQDRLHGTLYPLFFKPSLTLIRLKIYLKLFFSQLLMIDRYVMRHWSLQWTLSWPILSRPIFGTIIAFLCWFAVKHHTNKLQLPHLWPLYRRSMRYIKVFYLHSHSK